VNFRVLEKSMRVLGRSWKSPGNLFQKKGTNPERHVEWGKPKAKATKLCKARPQGPQGQTTGQ